MVRALLRQEQREVHGAHVVRPGWGEGGCCEGLDLVCFCNPDPAKRERDPYSREAGLFLQSRAERGIHIIAKLARGRVSDPKLSLLRREVSSLGLPILPQIADSAECAF